MRILKNIIFLAIIISLIIASCKTIDKTIYKNKHTRLCNEENNFESCYELGRIKYRQGKTIEAKDLFKRACSSGFKKACTSKGAIDVAIGDRKSAFSTLTKECEKNDYVACFGLAEIEFEIGNKQNALELYQKACSGGYIDACWSAKHKMSVPKPEYRE